jgi:hypothetical protein
MLARLQPGLSAEQALASINNVYGGILNEVEAPLNGAMPADALEQFRNKRIRFETGGERKGLLRNTTAQPLAILLGITALVLIIVCVNIANRYSCAAFRRPERWQFEPPWVPHDRGSFWSHSRMLA